MALENLERIEAMVLSLRDQLDRSSERIEQRLAEQQRTLHRLHADLIELGLEARAEQLEREPAPRAAGRAASVTPLCPGRA